MNEFTMTSASALAYLGDSVIELEVRELLIKKGYEKSAKLNTEARKFVTAVAQSKAFLKIADVLTKDEADIARRARNSSHLNVPKSASATEYKNATSLEAIFGYLHISGNSDRIKELFGLAYSDIIRNF